MVERKCDHTETVKTFSELTIGTVARFGTVEFVKLSEGQPDLPVELQHPNAMLLDNNHYVVIGNRARCEVIKTIYDPEYCHPKLRLL